MAQGIVGMTPEGKPIYGEVPDQQAKGASPLGPITGATPTVDPGVAPHGNPLVPPVAPQPSTPITGGGAPVEPRLPVLPSPQAPVAAPQNPADHPGNRRWREARARGMSAAEYQAQQAGGAAPAPVPGATLVPPPAPPPVTQPAQLPAQQPQDQASARYAGQRQYLQATQPPKQQHGPRY